MSMSTTGSCGSNNNNFFNNLEMREHLFDKVLTPTDVVKKPARIVIPKRHALDYFPPLFMNGQRNTLLYFTDRNGKTWKFEYWLWKNSRMYVFRHDWGSFLEEKQLVAGDKVSFYRAYIPDNSAPERRRRILLIDWSYRRFSPFYLGHGVNGESNNTESPLDDNHRGRSEPLVHPSEPSQPSKKIRLFGVDIKESSSGDTHGEMGVIGCTSWVPSMIRDDGESSRRSPSGEMGASSSSVKQLSDDEDRRRKGKSVQF